MMLPSQFFVTGTDTDVGKTITSAVLCAALDMEYWKPIQSGLESETDSHCVSRLSQVQTHLSLWSFPRPASPHRASLDVNVSIGLEEIILPTDRPLLVEGVGGICVPLCMHPTIWQEEIIQRLSLPVIVVARSGLGTLNHTTLTVKHLRTVGVQILGLILVGEAHLENTEDLPVLCGVPVLATIPWMMDIEREFSLIVDSTRQQLEAV
jgi:dethiobiotin synthase